MSLDRDALRRLHLHKAHDVAKIAKVLEVSGSPLAVKARELQSELLAESECLSTQPVVKVNGVVMAGVVDIRIEDSC